MSGQGSGSSTCQGLLPVGRKDKAILLWEEESLAVWTRARLCHLLSVPENGLWPSLITMKTYNQQLLLCQVLALRKKENQTAERGKLKALERKGWQRMRVISELEFVTGGNGIGSWAREEGRNGWEETGGHEEGFGWGLLLVKRNTMRLLIKNGESNDGKKKKKR